MTFVSQTKRRKVRDFVIALQKLLGEDPLNVTQSTWVFMEGVELEDEKLSELNWMFTIDCSLDIKSK